MYLSLVIIKLVTPELAHHETQHWCSKGALPPCRTARPGPLQSPRSEKPRSERGGTCTGCCAREGIQDLLGCQRKDSTTAKHLYTNRYLQLQVPQAKLSSQSQFSITHIPFEMPF